MGRIWRREGLVSGQRSPCCMEPRGSPGAQGRSPGNMQDRLQDPHLRSAWAHRQTPHWASRTGSQGPHGQVSAASSPCVSLRRTAQPPPRLEGAGRGGTKQAAVVVGRKVGVWKARLRGSDFSLGRDRSHVAMLVKPVRSASWGGGRGRGARAPSSQDHRIPGTVRRSGRTWRACA